MQVIANRLSVVEESRLAATIVASERRQFLRVAYDVETYVSATKTDDWNRNILSEIACLTQEENQAVLTDVTTKPSVLWKRSNALSVLPSLMVGLARQVSNVLRGVPDVELLVDSMTAKSRHVLLSELGLPSRALRFPKGVRSEVDLHYRDWKLPPADSTTLDHVVASLMPRHLPTCFLEGWAESGRRLSKLIYKRPQRIVVDMRHYTDAIVSRWIAESVELGTELIIWQHGGSYGSAAIHTPLAHDVAVADAFLSWGWEDEQCPTVVPFFSTKTTAQPEARVHERCDKLLLAVHDLDRFPTWIGSGPQGSRVLKLGEDLRIFLNALSGVIRTQSVMRFMPNEHGWHVPQDILSEFPEVRFGVPADSYGSALQTSRLAVQTADATTLIESILADVPTILIINPETTHYSAIGKQQFRRLKNVGIAFDDPVNAANHVIDVWEKPLTWWESERVVSARAEFLRTFGRTTSRLGPALDVILRGNDGGWVSKTSEDFGTTGPS
jgi:putative transferase (TIGR04331 family)